jgi:hypothetical protein
MKYLCPCWLMLALAVAGCASKSKKDAKARAAFLAGQQQAVARMYDLDRTGIRILGPVQNPLIAWKENLTLAETIVAAGYVGARDPREIIIIREGQPIRVDPGLLLHGEDVPLQPSDIVEVRP